MSIVMPGQEHLTVAQIAEADRKQKLYVEQIKWKKFLKSEKPSETQIGKVMLDAGLGDDVIKRIWFGAKRIEEEQRMFISSGQTNWTEEDIPLMVKVVVSKLINILTGGDIVGTPEWRAFTLAIQLGFLKTEEENS